MTNMPDIPSLSVEHVELVSVRSAALTLRNDGQAIVIGWYSINGGPPQGRAPPVFVGSDRSVLMYVILIGPGPGFQPGRNELRLWTSDGAEHLFILTFR